MPDATEHGVVGSVDNVSRTALDLKHWNQRAVVVQASLTCLQCGRHLGWLERPPGSGLPELVVFRPAGSNSISAVSRRHIRCSICNGVAILEDDRTVYRQVEDIDWRLDQPRRGRPPAQRGEPGRRDPA
jgi:hypothetical protein